VTVSADAVAGPENAVRSAVRRRTRAGLNPSLDVMRDVTVDLVASEPPHRGCTMVMVEEGPWSPDSIVKNLERVQMRLHACLAVALDGLLAEKYPRSSGEPLVIRLDAFNVPNEVLRAFFVRFTSEVLALPTYAPALSHGKFVSRVTFELNLSDLPNHV
jgi:hypothetical protein